MTDHIDRKSKTSARKEIEEIVKVEARKKSMQFVNFRYVDKASTKEKTAKLISRDNGTILGCGYTSKGTHSDFGTRNVHKLPPRRDQRALASR